MTHLENFDPHGPNPHYATQKYGGYRSGYARLIAESIVEHTDLDDMCDPTRQTIIVEVSTDQPTTYKHVVEMLFHSFSPSPCYCEHDCCGHRFGGASEVRMLSFDRWEIVITTSRNY